MKQKKRGELQRKTESSRAPSSSNHDWSYSQCCADWLAFSTLPSRWLLPPLSSQQGASQSPSPLMLSPPLICCAAGLQNAKSRYNHNQCLSMCRRSIIEPRFWNRFSCFLFFFFTLKKVLKKAQCVCKTSNLGCKFTSKTDTWWCNYVCANSIRGWKSGF